MLHEKLAIAENFVRHHHVQKKEHSLSPQHNSSSESIQKHQLRLENYQVLDLSKRYESNIGSRKSPPTESVYQNDEYCSKYSAIKISPNSTTSENLDILSSQSPTLQLSLKNNSKKLAASIQKLYASHHHSIISSSSTPTNSSHQTQLSQGFPSIYPIYYPQKDIKNERDLSPSQSKYIKDEQLPIIYPSQQGYHHQHANLMHSFNLIKAVSQPNTISPKPSSSNKFDLLEDRLSPETGGSCSISGSPSSSSNYMKIKKTTSLKSFDQYQQQQQNKPTRPFKAYPRDPTVIAANFAATDSLYDNSKVERYSEYRKRILEQIRSANGGERTISNPKMRRINNNIRAVANCSIRSDESNNSDGQMNNSESEDRTGDSDNDNDSSSMAASIICETNLDNSDKMNNNNDDLMLNKNNDDSSCANKDAAYFERRRKNNAAAKKSRDRRRIKEDEIAIRAAYLERQNIELLCQLDALKSQLATITKNMKN